jgi:hypothetical protein
LTFLWKSNPLVAAGTTPSADSRTDWASRIAGASRLAAADVAGVLASIGLGHPGVRDLKIRVFRTDGTYSPHVTFTSSGSLTSPADRLG